MSEPPMTGPTTTEPPRAQPRLTPVSILSGLLFRPADTMWKLRDEGPMWMSLTAAWILGGLGLGQGLMAAVALGGDRPFWVYWAWGVAVLAVEFGATMLLVHLSALLVWRLGPNPVMTAGMRTLLRLGGYWSLPSSLTGLVLSALVLLAARLGGAALKMAIVLVVPLALAGWMWAAVFRLRILRTVYLTTWGQALAMGIILLLAASIARAPSNLVSIGPEAAIADVGWHLHLSLGADPKVIEALESIPQARSSVRVAALSREPQAGDLIAYYRDREAPPIHRGARLPEQVVIGWVLAGPGQEAGPEDWPDGAVPAEQVLVRPAGDPRTTPHQPEVVPMRSVAGYVQESDLRLHIWITRLLLR